MRELSQDEMLTLVCSAQLDIELAEKNLSHTIDDLVDEKYLSRGVKEGIFSSTTVEWRGKKAYIYFYHVTPTGCLHINASQYVGEPGQGDTNIWTAGGEMIAKSLGLKAITFQTRRLAHITQAQMRGARIVGVCMRKDL